MLPVEVGFPSSRMGLGSSLGSMRESLIEKTGTVLGVVYRLHLVFHYDAGVSGLDLGRSRGLGSGRSY